MNASLTKSILLGATILTASFALPQAASSATCANQGLGLFTAPCTFGASDQFTFTLLSFTPTTGSTTNRTLNFSTPNTITFNKVPVSPAGSFSFSVATTSPEFFTSVSLTSQSGSFTGVSLTQPDTVNLTSIGPAVPFSSPYDFANNGLILGTFSYGSGNAGGALTFTTDVPLPLPIVGAGLAFGFTRKLRKRAKVAA
jgi:hypothetical protein